MALFGKKRDRPTAAAAAGPAGASSASRPIDVAKLRGLITDYSLAVQHDTPDRTNALNHAVRAISCAGSGASDEGLIRISDGGAEVSVKTWQWVADCSSAARTNGDGPSAVAMAMFAISWDEIADGMDVGNFMENGLMQPPPAILAQISGNSVVAGESLDPDDPVWFMNDNPISARTARRGHSRVVLELLGKGVSVDEHVRVMAEALAGGSCGTPLSSSGVLPDRVIDKP